MAAREDGGDVALAVQHVDDVHLARAQSARRAAGAGERAKLGPAVVPFLFRWKVKSARWREQGE